MPPGRCPMSAAVDSIARAVATANLHARAGTVLHTSGEVATVTGLNLAPRELAFIEDPAGRLARRRMRRVGGG